jgi:hypothetical protein
MGSDSSRPGLRFRRSRSVLFVVTRQGKQWQSRDSGFSCSALGFVADRELAPDLLSERLDRKHGLKLLDRGGLLAPGAQPNRELSSNVGIRCALFQSSTERRDGRTFVATVVRQNPRNLERSVDPGGLILSAMLNQRICIVSPVLQRLAELFQCARRITPGPFEHDCAPDSYLGLLGISRCMLELPKPNQSIGALFALAAIEEMSGDLQCLRELPEGFVRQ